MVLTNYARPHLMSEAIRAWSEQTVRPARVVVVDNSPNTDEQERYPRAELSGADDVWRMGTNLGCPCHFYPALAHFEHEYTVFADDDFLPGRNALAHLLGAAKAVDDKFSTIGGTGRDFLLDRRAGLRYRGNSVPRTVPGKAVRTHLTCRSHLVRTDYLYHVIPFRRKFLKYGDEGFKLASVHDDFLLCMGLQIGTGFRSYTIERPEAHEDRLFLQELDTAGGLWRRPEHFKERNRMVDIVLELGWKPL